MSFPPTSLVPIGGAMYSHIFENPAAGITRDHFWSVTVEFAPIEYAGEQRKCALTMEWLRIPVRTWRSLGDASPVVPPVDELMECSFYMCEHDWAAPVELSFQHAGADRFVARMAALVEFSGYIGGDEDPSMPVSGTTDVTYEGLIVVSDNVPPKPTTPAAVRELASPFVDVADYLEPEYQDFRYVMRPMC